MVIYDLACDNDHGFEGWFSGPENFREQLSQGLIACPVCNSTSVTKLPHACAVHMRPEERQTPPAPRAPAPEQIREALIRMHHYVETHFEDVGRRFADEARRIHAGEAEARPIHAGEAEARPIHGTATAEQREALDDDSIPYMMLPKPNLDG